MNRLLRPNCVFALVTSLTLLWTTTCAHAADVKENQWVRPSVDGSIKGRIVVPKNSSIIGVAKAKIALISESGKAVTKPVVSDSAGRFTLRNVPAGVYTLLARGDESFACCALHVVDESVDIADSFDIAAGAVDYTIVRSAMLRYLPPGGPTPVEFDPMSNPLLTDRAIVGDTIRIAQQNGGLKGRLTRAGFAEKLGAGFTNVIVYQGGNEVARAVTDENGDFELPNLAPGSYSLLGSGKDGFGLMGLELIDPLGLTSGSRKGNEAKTLVTDSESENHNTFVMQIAPMPGVEAVIDEQIVEERPIEPAVPLDYAPTAYAGGGYPLGGGAVGGGGSGGGGFGGIAALGGIGAAIAIAASNDNDRIQLPPVSSPSSPTSIIRNP